MVAISSEGEDGFFRGRDLAAVAGRFILFGAIIGSSLRSAAHEISQNSYRNESIVTAFMIVTEAFFLCDSMSGKGTVNPRFISVKRFISVRLIALSTKA